MVRLIEPRGHATPNARTRAANATSERDHTRLATSREAEVCLHAERARR